MERDRIDELEEHIEEAEDKARVKPGQSS